MPMKPARRLNGWAWNGFFAFSAGAAALGTAAGPCAAASVAQHAPFKISRATTYLTSPVLPSGRINYVAALNAMARRGVTAKNNAGILVARTFGPASFPTPNFAKRFRAALSIVPVTPPAHYRYRFTSPGWCFLPRKYKSPTAKDWALFTRTYEATGHPWTTARYPRVAAWIKTNHPALLLLLRASKLDNFYLPILKRHPHGPFFSIRLPTLAAEGDQNTALLRYAMHSVARGHAETCEKILLGAYRLAALESRQPVIFANLVGFRLGGSANRAVRQLVIHHDLSTALERRMLRGLRGLPRFGSVATTIGSSERYAVLDAIERLALGHRRLLYKYAIAFVPVPGRQAPKISPAPKRRAVAFLANVRWNLLLRNINVLVNKTVAALRGRTYAIRLLKLTALVARVNGDHASPKQLPWLLAPENPRNSTRILRNFFVTAAYASEWNPIRLMQYQDDVVLQRRMAEIALALAIYHAHYHAYPRTLTALTPKYLPHTPRDPFTDGPPKYAAAAGGYTLRASSPLFGRNRVKRGRGYVLRLQCGA